MLGVDGKTLGGDAAHAVLVDVQVQDDAALGGDLRRDLELEIGLAKSHRGGAARGFLLIRQLGALLDQGLDLVGGDDAGAGDDLALAVGLHRRDFQVQQARERRIEQRNRKARCAKAVLPGSRQIDEAPCGGAVSDSQDRHAVRGGHGLDVGGAELAVAVAVDGDRPTAESGAQGTAKGVGCLDDAGLDQHLPHRYVELADQRLYLRKFGRDVRDKHLVGAGVGQHAAAGRQDARRPRATGAREAAGDLGRAGVIELELLRARGFKPLQGPLRFHLGLFAGGHFGLGRNLDHIAGLSHAQRAAFQNDVQRLLPGHVLEPQGDGARDRVRDHQVVATEVGHDLQERANFDVLKIQRHQVAGGGPVAARGPVRGRW